MAHFFILRSNLAFDFQPINIYIHNNILILRGLIPFPGRVGQIRFCLRRDADPSSYGRCQIEEVRGFQPHPDDVVLFMKKYMADPEPSRVITVVPASTCAQLRNAFQQPQGHCPRRPIGPDVKKNILSCAPACHRQGIINSDALAYLTSWVGETLVRVPRPVAYTYLTLRRHPIHNVPPDLPVRGWVPPGRNRVITVFPKDAEESDSDDNVHQDVPLNVEE